MSLSKFILGTTSIIIFTACAPGVEQSAGLGSENASSHEHAEQFPNLSTDGSQVSSGHRATVKPGAAVTLKTVLPTSMTPGTFQTVKLELTDGYQDGIMTVSIEPGEGLNLFGGSNSKTFDMSSPGPHVWDVDVNADNSGVYFLNVFSQAQGMRRSFSVRLDVGVSGDEAQKMFDEAMPADGDLTDSPEGGKIRVLGAAETIQ